MLDGSIKGTTQGEALQLSELSGGDAQAPIVDPQWLRDSLLATGRSTFCSPVKKLHHEVIKMQTVSPVSPLDASWSPRSASLGPPLKTRKASA